MKLRKIVKVGATVQYEQSYLGGLEYRKNGTGSTRVEAVYHAEGRYLNLNAEVNNTLLWQKEYTLKDHLGNARISFTDKNANGIVDVPSDIVQENHYYPFGLNYEGGWRMNDVVAKDSRYLYNNKELSDDFGLNLYAYGARYYDAAIGRFTGVDPIADQFAWVSPFNYAENTPINAIDLHGLQAYYVHGTNQSNRNVTTNLSETLNFLKDNVATAAHKTEGVNTSFDWSKQAKNLANTAKDRAEAAKALKDHVVANHVEGEPITLIGYSHGGNVAAQAASLISEALGGIEINLITLATPASNQITGPLSRDGIPQGPSRFSENPDNPSTQRAVLDWYHFYTPNDPVAGGASMIYESSDLNYRSETVKNIKVSPADVPGGMGNAHSFPYYPTSISSAWTRFPVKERQRSPLTTKR